MTDTPDPYNEWSRINNFDLGSARMECYVSGLPKRDGEDFIIRGPHIDMEGFFDISLYAAEQLAKLIGWVPPDEADEAKNKMRAAQGELHEALTDLAVAEGLLSGLEARNVQLSRVNETVKAERDAATAS
ncbi:MAG: hypothetical protein V3U14_12795 [candidate division NC10 bacterium]